MRRNRIAITGLAAAAVAVVAYQFIATNTANGVEVTIPPLTEAGARGQLGFGKYCAECHGPKADGTDKGPPLIHKIYHPGHHGDASIVAAARRGARGHHWPFGDMKPVEGVSDAGLAEIIAFIREVQYANGIY